MKYLLLSLLIGVTMGTSAQTLEQKYTPFLYLGAPKEKLIDFAVSAAKSFYDDDLGGVRKKQKKKGIDLGNKESLETFFKNMEKDMRAQLSAKNNWTSNDIDFTRWDLSIADLMSLGFELPGFREIQKNSKRGKVVLLSFKNEKVNSIYTSLAVGSPSDQPVFPYENYVLDSILKAITSNYSARYNITRISCHGFLGDKSYPSYTEKFSLSNNNTETYFQFDYNPCGAQDRAGNWIRHKGASLQNIYFTTIAR